MKSPLPDDQFITLLPESQNPICRLFLRRVASLSESEDIFRQTFMTPWSIRRKHEAATVEFTFLLTT